jgi:hypothetical protein
LPLRLKESVDLKEAVGFEVFTAVVMKSTIFPYVMQCSPLEAIRLKEPQRHIPTEHPDKQAVTEQIINLELRHTTILLTKPRYTDRIIREAIKIELHPNNIVACRPPAGQRPQHKHIYNIHY